MDKVPPAVPVGVTVTANVGVAATVGVVTGANFGVDEATGVNVPVAAPGSPGFAVVVAEANGVAVADALADTPTLGVAELVAEVVADAKSIGVAVGTACPEAAVGGSNPQSSPATSSTGTAVRLIHGSMRISIEVDP